MKTECTNVLIWLAFVTEDVTVDLYSILTLHTAMHLQSTATTQKPGFRALKTTVPLGIIAFLGIQAGDKLVWKMEKVGDQRVAIVSKM